MAAVPARMRRIDIPFTVGSRQYTGTIYLIGILGNSCNAIEAGASGRERARRGSAGRRPRQLASARR
jgi:hypothetical protein